MFLITDVSDASTNISMNISELLELILEKKLAFLQTFNAPSMPSQCAVILRLLLYNFFFNYAKIEYCD